MTGVLLFVFLIMMLSWLKRNITALGLIFLSILSLLSGLVVDYSMPFMGLESIVVILIMALFTYLLIQPFSLFPKSFHIDESIVETSGFRKYSNLMIFIGLFSMAIYLPIYFVVCNMDIDINQFKYDGGFEQFVYSGAFPIPVKIYIIVIYLGEMTILLLPIHFLYLVVGDKRKAVLSFIGSLTYLFKGLVFFSRATPVIYVLLYFFLFLLLKNNLPKKILKYLKLLFLVGGIILSIGFISTSINRFEDGKSVSGLEENHTGDMHKYIDDPTMISCFDYLGQGYYNSYYLLSLYNGTTFKTQVTFHDIYSLLNQYLGFPFSEKEYMDRRQSLWKTKWCSFTTYTCYVIYDFGLVISLLLTIIMHRKIKSVAKNTYAGGYLTFLQLNNIIFFLFLASTSIFFSSLASCIIPYIFFRFCNKFIINHSPNLIVA